MNLITAITTYNRIEYLKKTYESWLTTKSPQYNWILIIADDGSTDGTIEYLQNIPCQLILSKRRGIHHQANQILRIAEHLSFDFAFKFDDDIIFKQPGWDTKFIEASKITGFDHLVFHDLHWKRKQRFRDTIAHSSGLLECKAWWNDTQGAFWTFTPRVLQKVGYFDIKNFGLCGLGHRDYTFRCCKAGFNNIKNIFDIKDSNLYLELIKNDYDSAPDHDKCEMIWNSGKLNEIKTKKLFDNRLYIPCATSQVNLYNKQIIKLL